MFPPKLKQIISPVPYFLVGRVRQQVVIGSKEQAAECMKRVVRRRVMFSSTRQAAAGLLTAGAVHGVRYVANKMCKAWKSRV